MDKATLRDGRLSGVIAPEDVPAVIEALRAAKGYLAKRHGRARVDDAHSALPDYIKEMIGG